MPTNMFRFAELRRKGKHINWKNHQKYWSYNIY